MGEVVISFRIPEALKRELYKAVGEAQARSGEKIELKQVGSIAVALAIAYLREELLAECTEPAKQLLAVGARG